MPRNTSGLRRGGGGRAKGTPNKVTAEVKELAGRMVGDPVYLESLARRVNSGRAPHMEPLLWHYAYGKPKETHELVGEGGGPVRVLFVDVIPPEAA